jgi:hypothetical protein
MCNKCNQTKCCCESPTRYGGPSIDCIGLTQGTAYDAVIQQLAEFLCDIEFEDGVGIFSITWTSNDGELGEQGTPGTTDTYTITLTDSSTYTFTVTNGSNGTDGTDGADGADGNYVVQTVEPAGVNCANGGTRIEVFDGQTDLLLTTTYVCNGIDATLPATTSYGLFAQTADSTTVVDPVPGSLVGTGVGSLTIDPLTYTWAAGDSFTVKAAGLITCSNTQELTISIKDGNSNTLATTGLIDLKTATANDWNLEVTFTLRSTGSPGEMVSAGMFTYIPDPAGQAFEGSDFSVVTNTIDTTVINTFEIVASFNLDESGTNSIYSELLTLTKIY